MQVMKTTLVVIILAAHRYEGSIGDSIRYPGFASRGYACSSRVSGVRGMDGSVLRRLQTVGLAMQDDITDGVSG
jgi:hypothetical protein